MVFKNELAKHNQTYGHVDNSVVTSPKPSVKKEEEEEEVGAKKSLREKVTEKTNLKVATNTNSASFKSYFIVLVSCILIFLICFAFVEKKEAIVNNDKEYVRGESVEEEEEEEEEELENEEDVLLKKDSFFQFN